MGARALSTQRWRLRRRGDEAALTAAIIRLAMQYGRYGYRRVDAFEAYQL